MESRTVTKLLLFAVTTAVFVTIFGLPRRADGPMVFTRFDVALLALGSLALTGLCLRVPAIVAATPSGRRAETGPRSRSVARRRSAVRYAPLAVRYAPLAVLGHLLLTATGALAQGSPAGPYVGEPRQEGTAPNVGEPPPTGTAPYVGDIAGGARAPQDADAYVYVDGLVPAAPTPEPSAGTLSVGRALTATPAALEPARVGPPIETSTDPAGGTPVTSGDVVGLAVLAGAVLSAVLLPRRRFR